MISVWTHNLLLPVEVSHFLHAVDGNEVCRLSLSNFILERIAMFWFLFDFLSFQSSPLILKNNFITPLATRCKQEQASSPKRLAILFLQFIYYTQTQILILT